MKTQETKEKFIELRAKGLSFKKIAKKLGVSKHTLINWSKDLKMEIANLKAIELEALYEKYYLTEKRRIELFGEKLKEIKEELDNRDFREISTEKLLDLILKYHTKLKEEYEPLVLKRKKELPSMKDLLKKRLITEEWDI